MALTNYTNLAKVINDPEGVLSDEAAFEIMQRLCHGCRQRTKDRVRSVLRYGLHTIDSCGILERVQYCDEYGWEYVPGQDDTAERKVVRDIILGK